MLSNKGTYRASFYTLGCRLNQSETALISDSFFRRGYRVVDFGEATDVCVINTCTVTEQADAKCRQLVRQVLKKSPDAMVAVVGCYAQMASDILCGIEGLDLVVGTQDKMRISEMFDVPQKLPETVVIKNRIRHTPFSISSVGNYEHATRANLKVQDGCDFMCSFCVIPFARGRSRSRAFWDIQREAIELVANGHKELVLTGVNVGCYSFEEKGLLDVVKMLEHIDGLDRIRISSIEPTTIPSALVDHMAESEKLCPHFHIPLQSGDDTVLREMKRLYTASEYASFLERLAVRIPNVCLGTDVMVGFPGERETAYENTRRLLSDLPFAYFHVFPFSERAGTPAVKMAGKVLPAERKERSQQLRELSQQKRSQFHVRQLGKTVRVLMEERNAAGLYQGFTDNYARVGAPTQVDLANKIVDVHVRSLHAHDLAMGEVVNGGGSETSAPVHVLSVT